MGFECGYCEYQHEDWKQMESHHCLISHNLVLDDTNRVWREVDCNVESQDEAKENHDEAYAKKAKTTEWSHEAVLLLIDIYRKFQLELDKKNSMKKHIWQRATYEINAHGYDYTWDQLQNKWKSLLRTYKAIKDHNNESGRDRKNWTYFETMDQLLQKNPIIEPPLLIHNGVELRKDELPNNDEMENSDSTSNLSALSESGGIKKSMKRKSTTSVTDLLKLAIDESKRQHEDNLLEKKRFNDLLEKLINSK